jgi:hypothetical protein
MVRNSVGDCLGREKRVDLLRGAESILRNRFNAAGCGRLHVRLDRVFKIARWDNRAFARTLNADLQMLSLKILIAGSI